MAETKRRGDSTSPGMSFERPIQELEDKLAELESISLRTNMDLAAEVEALRRKLSETIEVTYKGLSPWQRVCVARHDKRPTALDFIEKPWEDDTLINTVRRALDRDRETRTRRDTVDSISRRVASLTPRESEVFRHVIAGRLNKQIAAKLGTAEKTIKVHRAHVMEKMQAGSVAERVRGHAAARHGDEA